MITNNPYNIPERPVKQRKVMVEASPLFPHQLNRSQEPELKHNPHNHKKPGPYFLESSVTEVSRLQTSPQQSVKSHNLQMSSVTQWQGYGNIYNSSHPPFPDVNEKIAFLTQRLDSHQRKLAQLMESRKPEPLGGNLTDSSYCSFDSLSQSVSRQLERYQSTEQAFGKMREEFKSYRSQSQKLGEQFRAKLDEQKEDITQQLLSSFKESLQEKFNEEEARITEFLTDFSQNQHQKMKAQLAEIRQEMKQYCRSHIDSSSKKGEQKQHKVMEEFASLKAKLQLFTVAIGDFQSNYRSFKEQIMDNILATQDHKRWLYETDHKIEELRQSLHLCQQLDRGSLKVSKEYCMKQKYHLRYEEYLSIAEKEHSIKSLERTYLVDEQGYLLDSNHFYIVDSTANRIRLSEPELEMLKSSGLLT